MIGDCIHTNTLNIIIQIHTIIIIIHVQYKEIFPIILW